MSLINNSDLAIRVSNILKITHNENFMDDVDNILHKLLDSVGVRQLLEEKDVGENSVNSFIGSLNSVKLLLDIIDESSKSGSAFVFDTGVGEILQCIRDVIDVAIRNSNFPDDFPFDLLLDTIGVLFSIVSRRPADRHVKELANFHQYNLYMVKVKHSLEWQDNPRLILELSLRLRVIATVIEVYLNIAECKDNEQETSNFVYVYRKQLNDNDIPESIREPVLLSKLVTKHSKVIAAQTLLCILPKYIRYCSSNAILQNIWDDVSSCVSDHSNGTHYSRSFLIMCYLSDLYFRQNDTHDNLIYNILSDEKYWILLQNGLMHTDGLIRKQALYLFKKSIEEMRDNNYVITCHKRDELNVCNFDKKLNDGVLKLKNGMKNFMISNNKIFLVHNDSKNILWWDSDLKEELYQIYQNIFLVIESVEEKQSHLVKPILDIVLKIIESSVVPFRNGKVINISWSVVIFQRLLAHDSIGIVKWGVEHMMKVPVDVYPNEEVVTAVVRLLVKSLSDVNLYCNEDLLPEQMKEYFVNCSKSDCAKAFFKILIREICGVTWSPESLFHLVHALAHVPKSQVWQSEEVLLVKRFVADAIGTHNTLIRSGVQCRLVTCLTNLADATTIKLETVADVLGAFRAEESVQRGSPTWRDVVSWLEYCYSKRNAEEFILSFLPYGSRTGLDARSCARMTVLLHDAHLFGIMKCCGETPSCKIISVIGSMLSSFKDCDKRSYSDAAPLDHNLAIISLVVEETLGSGSPEQTRLIEVMLPFFQDMVTYIQTRVRSIVDMSQFYSTKLYLDAFENILKALGLFKVDSAVIVNGLLVQILSLLEITDGNEGRRPPSIQRYLAMKLLRLAVNHVFVDRAIPKLRHFQRYFRRHINETLSKTEAEANLTRDLQTLWGRMNSEYLEAKWYLLERLKSENLFQVANGSLNVEKFIGCNELVLFCIEALEIGGYSVLLPVMSVVQEVVCELSNDVVFCKVAEVTWSCVLERRKSDGFETSVRQFVAMLFQQELMAKKNSHIDRVLLEYSDRIFSTSLVGLACILLQRVQQLGVRYNLSLVLCSLLATGLLYGPPLRRDERLTAHVCSLVDRLQVSPLKSTWSTGGEVRARSIQAVISLDRGCPEHQRFAACLVDCLLDRHLEATRGKTRYFRDSQVHRIKHRLMQSLLLIEPYLSQEASAGLVNWVLDNIVAENHQHSVRYLEEWLCVRLLRRHPPLAGGLWSRLVEGADKRVGSLCSLMSVAFHTARLLPDMEVEAWLDRAMQLFLPYCMAQHFSVRLYAQVIVQKLWQLAVLRGCHSTAAKYSVVSECLATSIDSGNSVKNCHKLQDDFYFTTFDPAQHYSLQTLYHDLPRLANVGSDEFIPTAAFRRCGVAETADPSRRIPLATPSDALKNREASGWTLKATDTGDEAGETVNFQKKMIPLKSLIPDEEELFSVSPEAAKRRSKTKTGGLIVVASLIDKPPNLGGLGRTCEVFGVSDYVIGSLKYTEDKQFQSLSVTAEKWISITEVKPHHLSDYLCKMKQQGYTVVGAEQTAHSQPLDHVQFPKKTILLLGNEKEGIPAQLLPLVDLCVEVPQLGVVRSLNVHVTGAIFIWEYAKQHSFPGGEASEP